jgi:hypothetical protein
VDIGFEVLTAVVMKATILWDIAPCSHVNRRFGRTYRLQLHGRKSTEQETNPQQVAG